MDVLSKVQVFNSLMACGIMKLSLSLVVLVDCWVNMLKNPQGSSKLEPVEASANANANTAEDVDITASQALRKCSGRCAQNS